MYIADNHVAGMLWEMKGYKRTIDGLMEYMFPQHTPGLYTMIVGEWFTHKEEDYFLIHEWNNKYVSRKRAAF